MSLLHVADACRCCITAHIGGLLISGAGCTINETPPAQGDVRLVDIDGINASTAPCDDVHFGGVEIYNDGRWGRICVGNFLNDYQNIDQFNVDAVIICRQLGFPFGSVMDLGEVREDIRVNDNSAYLADPVGADYSGPRDLVWATDVQCTGLEERLDECFFSEMFGTSPRRRQRPADDEGPPPPPPPPGIPEASCSRRDGDMLAVVCRRFEIKGNHPDFTISLGSAALHTLSMAICRHYTP